MQYEIDRPIVVASAGLLHFLVKDGVVPKGRALNLPNKVPSFS